MIGSSANFADLLTRNDGVRGVGDTSVPRPVSLTEVPGDMSRYTARNTSGVTSYS